MCTSEGISQQDYFWCMGLSAEACYVPITAALESIFDSLVQYCSVAWDNCDKTLVIRLQKLQNRAATVLTFSGYDADADYLIKRINWQNLDSQRKYHKKVMVYRSINGLAPKYLSISCLLTVIVLPLAH